MLGYLRLSTNVFFIIIKDMKYNTYLPSLPKVSEIGLGAWQLGIASGWKGLTDAEAAALV